MYSYQEFCQKTMEWFEEFGEEWFGKGDYEIELAFKPNCIRTGMRCSVEKNPTHAAPMIYLENFYNSYLESKDFLGVMGQLKNCLEQALESTEMIEQSVCNAKLSKDNIVFELMHSEKNHEFLKTLPHRQFLNLSIVYRWDIIGDEGNRASAIVNKDMAKSMGLDEEELYQLAYKNTKEIREPIVVAMDKYVDKYMETGCHPELSEFKEDWCSEGSRMYVITNVGIYKGAINILYPDVLQRIVDRHGCDLYLIPSSVHEMIALPIEHGNMDSLLECIREVNRTLDIEDVLSNDVYKYDVQKQRIVQVTETNQDMLISPELEPEIGLETEREMEMW